MRCELVPIRLYERLIGVAEDYPTNPDGMRVTLTSMLDLVDRDHRFTAIGAAAALLDWLPNSQAGQVG